MTRNGVTAVVVTFHPDADVLTNLLVLRPEVERLIVVDNGSSQQELAALLDMARAGTFALVENGENIGIATALNIGVRAGLQAGAQLILTFDQDSRITPGFVATELAAFRNAKGRIGLVAPRYQDLRTGAAIAAKRLNQEGDSVELDVAITSGSLVRAEIFSELGMFVDELFIDGVDHEFSLRLRQAGYRLIECEAVLLHSPGTPREVRLLGRRLFNTVNYSATRRYYQQRNMVWMVRRYWRAFPGSCLGMVLHSARELAKILLAEKGDAGRKIRFFVHGLWDGLLGRMGPLPRK